MVYETDLYWRAATEDRDLVLWPRNADETGLRRVLHEITSETMQHGS